MYNIKEKIIKYFERFENRPEAMFLWSIVAIIIYSVVGIILCKIF